MNLFNEFRDLSTKCNSKFVLNLKKITNKKEKRFSNRLSARFISTEKCINI